MEAPMLRQYIEDSAAFDPEAIDQMSRAFSGACNELGVFAADERGREVLAVRIIELARAGAIDAEALKARLVQEARLAI
jgi:hypothetical protein